jgi:hypothetical protein
MDQLQSFSDETTRSTFVSFSSTTTCALTESSNSYAHTLPRNSPTPYNKFISLGYRCSSAGILKLLGLKQESLPFDWLVSRLPIIEHCIRTDFREFLNPDNYECIKGATHNYRTIDLSSRHWICDESICFNKYYESMSITDLPTLKYYLPQPISPARDAYGYTLMMNHRNIKTTNSDQEYFARCVERWTKSFDQRDEPIATPIKCLSLYIHPTIFYEEFLSIRSELIAELRRAHGSIFEYRQPHKQHGIYIIVVKTPFENPTNHCAKYVLEEQPDDESTPGCRICILWANKDFIDAGEIFMGNCHVEIYVVIDYLQKTIANHGV